MTPWLPRVSHPVLASALLFLSGCAGISVSPSTVLSTVVLVGEAMGAHTRSSGSGRSGGSGTSRSPGAARIPPSPPPTAVVARVLENADQYVGVPYVWGGNTPGSGFDCSGFTKYVFARQGISLPRVSRDQARAGYGVALDLAALLPGDLLLFAEPDEAISHVAIYVGDGQIIHSSQALGGVTYTDLAGDRAAWYVQNMVAVRRLTSHGR